jgi:hypothetical protein
MVALAALATEMLMRRPERRRISAPKLQGPALYGLKRVL